MSIGKFNETNDSGKEVNEINESVDNNEKSRGKISESFDSDGDDFDKKIDAVNSKESKGDNTVEGEFAENNDEEMSFLDKMKKLFDPKEGNEEKEKSDKAGDGSEEKTEKNLIFSGTADENSDYGKGGGKQFFIQGASELKQTGELVAISKENCVFNPETDIYSPDIRKSQMDKYTIHVDNRNLDKNEVEQLDLSTADDNDLSSAEENCEENLNKDEIEYLEENTPADEALTETITDDKAKEDYDHPIGNQEDSEGFNHPDAWSNPEELKTGDTYYQLLPVFKDGHESKSSYFTDKETIDSCRDENGNIVLSTLMQKLQKSPNKENIIDSDGNKHEEYVSEYSVIEYKYQKNDADMQ